MSVPALLQQCIPVTGLVLGSSSIFPLSRVTLAFSMASVFTVRPCYLFYLENVMGYLGCLLVLASLTKRPLIIELNSLKSVMKVSVNESFSTLLDFVFFGFLA